MSFPLKELRELPEDELIRRHDKIAENTSVGVSYYLEELDRRDRHAQGDRMEKLTWVILALTIVNVAAVVIDLACGK